MAYPSTLDSFTDPVSPTKLNSPAHDAQHSGVNNAAEALEAKVGVNGSAVTTSHDYKLSEVTGTDKVVGKTATQTLTNKTLTSPNISGATITSGNFTGDNAYWWNFFPAYSTISYVSASQLKVTGYNLTAIHPVGVRVNFRQALGAGEKYMYIIASSYGGGGTTFTVTGGTDYVVENSAISNFRYSTAIVQPSFPSHFHYTPSITYVGGTTDPTSNTINHAYFSVLGQTCFFHIKSTVVRGTGDRQYIEYTLPITRPNTDLITFSGRQSVGANSNLQPVCASDQTTKLFVQATMTGDGHIEVSGNYLIV